MYHNNNINNSQINYPIVIVFILCHLIFTIRQNRSSNHHIKLSRVCKSCDKKHDDRLYFMAFSLIVTLGNQMSYTSSKFGVSVYIKGSPRFLCCPMAFFLLDPWDVRELSIRKIADLPLQLLVGTFPRFVAIEFYFLSEILI